MAVAWRNVPGGSTGRGAAATCATTPAAAAWTLDPPTAPAVTPVRTGTRVRLRQPNSA